jgi:Uma2 family endonuclease
MDDNMVIQTQRYTVADFDRFVALAENADRLFEYIGGEVVEVPSNPYSSQIAARFLIELGIFLKGQDLGHVTGEAGGYQVSGERYAPDVAFIRKERQPQLVKSGYNPLPPDLAVEVFSPTDSEKKLSIKISNYLAAGTMVVVIYPDEREIAVHRPGQPVILLGPDDTFDGGDVLPGFTVAVKAILPPVVGL